MPCIKPLASDSETSRREFEFLLYCTQSGRDMQQPQQGRGPDLDRIDWETFVVKARKHGIMSLLYRNLHSKRLFIIPPAFLTKLEQDFHANAKRNLLLIREITRLITLLQTTEIPVLFFNGPLLGGVGHGNLSLHASADLDILVHEQDFPDLKCLLLAEGYLPPPGLSRFEGRSLTLCASECHFVQPATGVELEVHWQIPPRMISYASEQDQVWQRPRYSRIGSTRVPILSNEDLLLFFCVHGAKHFWERLGWICDIAGLIDASPALDWAQVIDRAEHQGSSRMLLLGLALVGDFTDTELPAEISARIRADQEVNELAGQVRQWLANGRTSEGGIRERLNFHLRLTNGFAAKIRYLFRLATTPTIGDLLLLNSPRAPLSLYYVIRPFRLLGKCVVRAVSLLKAELQTLPLSEWLSFGYERPEDR
jgi:hypothetical protein